MHLREGRSRKRNRRFVGGEWDNEVDSGSDNERVRQQSAALPVGKGAMDCDAT